MSSYGMPAYPQLPPPYPGAQSAPMDLPKELRRRGEQAFWSTQSYTDGAAVAGTNERVFTTATGGVGQGFAAALSIAETNMAIGGMIAGGLAFDVYAIACQPYYSAVSGQRQIVRADLVNVQNNCVLQWSFLNTLIDIAPASLIGAGGGAFGATADTGGVDGGAGGSRFAFNNGAGQVWAYRQNHVLLPSTTTFAIVLAFGNLASVVDGGPGSNNLLVRICLIGQFQTAIPLG